MIHQMQIAIHFGRNKIWSSEISVGLNQKALQNEYINPFSIEI